MASFTDQTPQFNPYVQQLPVEAMVKVGMEKQQRYDEGVQKIQTSIDNVAGLDIAKDSDKQYLQSKLNALGNNLKTVAAGDFSNYQLVNSVGGMATQIGKDKNIQNAVGSTAWYRKQRARIEKDVEDGVSNPANLDDFDKQASLWINSDKVGEKFNGEYSKYFDVDKFTKETFDAVSTDKYKFQDLYLTNPDGSHKRDAKGNLVYSTLAATLEQEGRFPPKVRETLNHIMSDPRVQKQLQISGKYNYKNYDAEALGKKVIAVKDDKYKNYANSLLELNLKKTSGQNVDDAISVLEDNMKKSDEQYLELFNNINKNPDGVRGYLYSDEVRNQYTTMYSKMSESRTFDENPAVRFEFDLQKERNNLLAQADEKRYRWASLRQSKEEGDKNRANALKIATLKGGKGVDSDGDGVIDTFTDDGATEKALPVGDLNIVKTFEDNHRQAAEVAGSATDALLFAALFNDDKNKKILSGIRERNPNMSIKEAQKIMIDNRAKDVGEDKAGFRARWLVKAQDMLSKNPQLLNPNQKHLLASANTAQGVYKDKRATWDLVHKEVENDLVKTLKPIDYQFGDTRMTLSPQDQYDIAISSAGNSPFASDVIKQQSKMAQTRLASKGISNMMVVKLAASIGKSKFIPEVGGWDVAGLNKLANQAIRTFTTTNPFNNERAFKGIKGGQNFLDLFDHVTDEKNTSLLKKQSEIIQKHTILNPALTTPLLTGDTDTDKAIVLALKNYIGQAGITGNESANFKGNAADMMDILNTNKGGASLDATKNDVTGEVTPVVVFTNESGEYAGEMTLTLKQAGKLGKTPTSWFQGEGTKTALSRLQLTNNGTTSLSGDLTSPYTYRVNDVLFDKDKFTNLQLPASIDVKGNIGTEELVGEDGKRYTSYFNYLYINDGGGDGGFVIPLGNPQSTMDQSVQALRSVNNQMIQQAIAEHKSIK